MSSRERYFRKNTCPACNLLPLETLSKCETTAPVTILLDHLDIEAIDSFASKCDLCRLLGDLHRHWKSPQWRYPMEYAGFSYWELCGRNEWRIRYTERTYLGIHVDFGKPKI